MIFSYNSKICRCSSRIPNLSIYNNSSNNDSNISKKMLLSKRIRLNGKINNSSKTSNKINIYTILFRRDYDEIKSLLFKIGKRQMNFYVNSLTCGQNSKIITLEILEIYRNILDDLEDSEKEKINNICV